MAIFSGETEALQLLFKDDLLTRVYKFVNNCTPTFGNLIRYIDALVHKRPDFEFLEIGAGTGSSTEDIVDVLARDRNPRFSQYAYTDISPSFFEKAEKRFPRCGGRMVFEEYNAALAPNEL